MIRTKQIIIRMVTVNKKDEFVSLLYLSRPFLPPQPVDPSHLLGCRTALRG